METRFTQCQVYRSGQICDSRCVANLESVDRALNILKLNATITEEELFGAVAEGQLPEQMLDK